MRRGKKNKQWSGTRSNDSTARDILKFLLGIAMLLCHRKTYSFSQYVGTEKPCSGQSDEFAHESSLFPPRNN
jgi:hypothetical protein